MNRAEDGYPGPFELPAESAEEDVNNVAAGRSLLAPDRIEDHLAGEDLLGVAHEQFEEIEFPLCEAEFFPGAGRLPCGGRQLEVSHCEDITGENADVDGDADEQLCRVARFEDGVAGTELQELSFSVDGVAGFQNDDGSIGDAPHSKKGIELVGVRKSEVEQNKVGNILPGARKCLPDGIGKNNLIAGRLKVVLEAIGNVGQEFPN